MKKLLVSVLAIAGLVACVNEQVLVQQGPAPMEFAGAFVENATRADVAADPSTTTNSLEGFDVWAFMDQPSGVVFNGEDVEGEKGNFSYTNTQYWIPGHVYYFAALAPMNSANWTLNTEAANTYGAGIVDFHNVAGTEDLLYAATSVSTEDKKLGDSMEAVKFQFNHLLSKVKFSFINGFTNNNARIDVTEVTMEVPAFASINLAQADWWSTNKWALVQDQFTTLKFGDACAMTPMGAKQETANERLTIPAGADQEYKVTFKVQLYFGDVAVFNEVQTLESVVKGVALEMGKSYNFIAEINSSNISEDGKELAPIVFDVEEVKKWEQIDIAEANSASDIQSIIENAEEEAYITLTGDITLDELLAGTLSTRAGSSASITIPAGKEVVLDLKDFTITGTDNETASFGMFNIQPGAKLTIEGGKGKIQLTAKNNRGWNAYSSVISNQRGTFVLNGGTIEHLGGTDMAYGIDNLTNGKGTYAETTINGGYVKSTYRAVRQFLNGTEAQNILTVNGGTIEGTNKSIWMQDPSKNANTGKLVVEAGAQLKGDVYLFVTAGSTEWPVEVSIASSALVDGSQVLSANVPAGLDVVEKDGRYVVEYGVEENGNEIAVSNAGGLKWIAQQVNSGADYFEGKTIVLTADIDLKGEEWTPIGSASKDHGFMGNFDGNGFVIKNLAINNIALDSDGYAYAGLFGVTEGVDKDNQNYIKNLTIENVDIETTGHIVAAAIAYPYYTSLENITVKGNISIKGGDYTAGVLSYTRRCVDATNIAIEANGGSIEGNMTIGGVISDIQMNGGLKANYSNFSAKGLTIKGTKSVGGISGIIAGQTLDGATVQNVTIECGDARKGIVSGALGEVSTIENVVYSNVTGADKIVGATYDSAGDVYVNGDVYSSQPAN